MGSATTPSTVSTATMPTSMTDAEATRLGLKSYVHGGSYVSGLAPTVTLSTGGGTLTTVVKGNFTPRQLQDGSWRALIYIGVTVSITARTGLGLAVVGITSKNTTDLFQPLYLAVGQTTVVSNVYIAPNSNVFTCAYASASTTQFWYGGDIELDSKPTWAY